MCVVLERVCRPRVLQKERIADPLMMVVAISASAAFLSPVGHSANILVMGPGGYRFLDYTKVGIPLTIVVLLISLLVVPIFWPF